MFFVKILFLCIVANGAFAASLPAKVKDELRRAGIPLSAVSIVVQDVHASHPIMALNAKRAINPASTMKLITTFAAIDILGPAYRWKTEAYLDGTLKDGVLQGDLVFKGYGDPKLTVERFWMWLRELRQRGLRDIRGSLILDHSFFEGASPDPGAFDNDPTRAYNVGPNALLLNFNALHLHLIPSGEETAFQLEPELAGYTVINKITTSNKLNCGGEDAFKERLDGHNIVLEGAIPASCGERDDYFSLLPHDEFFFAVFSALWKELGGTLQGGYRSGIAPIGQPPFSTSMSPPVSEVIRDINKFSNNTMARQVFLTLGMVGPEVATSSDLRARSGEFLADMSSQDDSPSGGLLIGRLPRDGQDAHGAVGLPGPSAAEPPALGVASANVARSTQAIMQWLKSKGMRWPELVLENGSGLSRRERISAQHLAEILQRATTSPFDPELEASLPILGMDGTVKKRFKGTDMAGYAHLKTGTLDGVKAVAGYVNARSGRRWVVVFVVNHPKAALAQPAQDTLIAWLRTHS